MYLLEFALQIPGNTTVSLDGDNEHKVNTSGWNLRYKGLKMQVHGDQ